MGTRGISNAQSGYVITTSTANIGNGLEVLTEVVEENTPKTRAGSQAVPSQDYHILVYKDGEKVVEWYGNSRNGTNFINYSDSPALRHLQPGTYKFYVYNHSHMKLSNKILTTNINIGSRNAYYIAEEKTIPNVKQYKLDFVLKPMFARVRTKFKTYINGAFGGDFLGNSSFKQGVIPNERYINPATGEATNILVARDSSLWYGKLDESGQGTEGENGAIKYYYTMTPDYTGNFFLEGTKLSQISFTFDDRPDMTIFRQKVANMTIENKLKADVTLKAGKSYTLVYTMYRTGEYLFNDGVVRTLAAGKREEKTPVAFVVDAQKRLLLHLKMLKVKNNEQLQIRKKQQTYGLKAKKVCVMV